MSAAVAELSGPFLARHARLVEEFENPDVWPKHVVVEYLWEQLPDADADAGLFAVLAACASKSPAIHLLFDTARTVQQDRKPNICSELSVAAWYHPQTFYISVPGVSKPQVVFSRIIAFAFISFVCHR